MKKTTILFIILFVLIFSGCNLQKNKQENKITIGPGNYELLSDLVIPKSKTLVINPGTTLRIGDNVSIIINGKIISKGTNNNPITFSGRNSYWRGIILNGTVDHSQSYILSWDSFDSLFPEDYINSIKTGNIFQNCIFKNIGAGEQYISKRNNYLAAIESYDSDVTITNSYFYDIKFIGGILAFDSYLFSYNNQFDSNYIHKGIHTNNTFLVAFGNNMTQEMESQPCNDGFWIIDSVAILDSNSIYGKGDDAIDLKGSSAIILNNTAIMNKDEGIDLDHGSRALIYKNTLEKNRENSILISSSSEAIMKKNKLSGKLTMRNKAKGYSVSDSGESIEMVFDITKEHEFCESYGKKDYSQEELISIESKNDNLLIITNSSFSTRLLSEYSLILESEKIKYPEGIKPDRVIKETREKISETLSSIDHI